MGTTSMNKLRKIASFVRWRLVPMRYLTMLLDLKWGNLFKSPHLRTAICREVMDTGYHIASPIDQQITKEIQALYQPRTATVVPKKHGHPFVNLFTEEDIHPDNPVFRLAFSSKILEVAADYFGHKLILDSIQVLYSYSTGGEIRESQHWHLDYGDSKSFHAVTYLNEVSTSTDGPFVFVDKAATRKVGRSLIVRRIADEKFVKELGNNKIHQFNGPAGSMVYVDPAVCYHYGSRCLHSRLAIFVTFNSWFPYAQPMQTITQNREKIFAAAKQVRPDLDPQFLRSILQLS